VATLSASRMGMAIGRSAGGTFSTAVVDESELDAAGITGC
jgi:hypothetical protein